MHINNKRIGWQAALAIGAFALAAAASAEVVLYERPNFNGGTFTASGETRNLASAGFNDRASSVVVRGGRWELCSDANFGGQCVTLGPGNYRSLRDMGLNNAVSSVRQVGGGGGGPGGGGGNWGGGGRGGDAIELYEHDRYQGNRITSNGAMPNLNQQGFNDRTSSIVIRRGNWDVCDDANFRGRCVTLGPGSYENLRQMGMNDRISSVRPGGGPGWGPGPGGQIGAPPPAPPPVSVAPPTEGIGPPHVVTGPDGAGEVVFRDGCVAYYDTQGRRFRTVGPCEGGQLIRADEAMMRYRRDQGR